MANKDHDDKLKTGDTDGVMVVVRTMVQSCIQDAAAAAKLAEKARYAQLLSGRLRLPVLESHRIVLAAWLSGLAGIPEVFDAYKAQYDLGSILDTVKDAPSEAQPSTGREVLDIIAYYQDFKRDNPKASEIEVVKREIRTYWATNPRRQTILAKFILVLNDELFLKSLETPAAKALVVDPGEVVSSMLSLPLRAKGYEVRVVGNVSDAVDALAAQLPDVAIVEMDMPMENGVVLCEKIKADPKMSHIPVIMLTFSKSQRVFRECMKAGAEDVLGRPVDIELVFIKLQKILGTRVAKPKQEGVAGSLKDIVLSDLVQILCAGGKSTRVEFTCDGGTGRIYIQEGEIIEAETGDLRAEEAFYKLMTWKDGTFAAGPCEQYPARSIQLSVMSLLMEAARRNDAAFRHRSWKRRLNRRMAPP